MVSVFCGSGVVSGIQANDAVASERSIFSNKITVNTYVGLPIFRGLDARGGKNYEQAHTHTRDNHSNDNNNYYILFEALKLIRVIIESVDSINRDERGLPLTQYITNGGISSAWNNFTHLNNAIVFYS